MPRRPRMLSLGLLALGALLATAPATDRSAAQGPPPLTAVAGGLINPRGLAWDAAGALVVAEAGTGGETVSDEVPAPTGPYRGGPTGRVSRIDAAGCPIPVAGGLPSAVSAPGESLGVADLAVVGDRVIALVAGGGSAHGSPDQPAGLYDVTDGEASLLADLGGWLRENPVAEPPADPDPDGVWSHVVATPAGDALWVSERDHGQILRVGLDGAISRVADLSARALAPAALAVDAAGALHVGYRTTAPFPGGAAMVDRIGDDGATETVWTGLTMVTGLAFGPDGDLYATEFSIARDQPPAFVPGSGRIVRRAGPDTSEEVVTGLNLPTTTRLGPDGALYVATPADGAGDGSGVVIRVDLSGDGPLALGSFDLSGPACATVDGQPDGETGGGPSGETAIPVTIVDRAFEPAKLIITAGSTVRWINAGSEAHTTVRLTGDGTTWDSGPIAPGGEYRQTFDAVGTYAYACTLHPEMTGTIEVVASGP